MVTAISLRQRWQQLLARLGCLPMIPPAELDFVGGVDFVGVGKHFLDLFVRLCNLSPDASVLDVGCGIGRIAIPLTGFLSRKGKYCGFDIVPQGIDWCRQRITPRFRHFRFELADVYNAAYNPTGRCRPSEYRFPYGDNDFDFVFLTSVFTHMLPGDLETYLRELARVLKPNGLCFTTYFLLNDKSRELLASKASTIAFDHEIEGCLTAKKECPEYALAYDEAVIRGLHKKYDLRIREPIYYGNWAGRLAVAPLPRTPYYSYQDIVVSSKCAAA